MMAYRYDDLAPGEIYHLFTRGVDKNKIFYDQADYNRCLGLLVHCLPLGVIRSYSTAKRLKTEIGLTRSGEGLVDLMSYCLMDNHFHLLIKENIEGGTSLYMQRLLNSYAKFFNVRHDRSGPLFTSRFKAVLVDGDEQLLQVSRYIHVNPYVAHMIRDPLEYRWSSLEDYISSGKTKTCHTGLISGMLDSTAYRKFIVDEADYLRAIEESKHLLIDIED